MLLKVKKTAKTVQFPLLSSADVFSLLLTVGQRCLVPSNNGPGHPGKRASLKAQSSSGRGRGGCFVLNGPIKGHVEQVCFYTEHKQPLLLLLPPLASLILCLLRFTLRSANCLGGCARDLMAVQPHADRSSGSSPKVTNTVEPLSVQTF